MEMARVWIRMKCTERVAGEQKLHRSSTGAIPLRLSLSAHILLTSRDIVWKCKFLATLVHFVPVLRFPVETTLEGTS
jgi:hypothetical protein